MKQSREGRSVFEGGLLELFEGACELVGTAGVLGAAANAVDLADDVVDLLSAHQLADTLQVTITSTQEEYLLDHIVLVGCHVDHA